SSAKTNLPHLGRPLAPIRPSPQAPARRARDRALAHGAFARAHALLDELEEVRRGFRDALTRRIDGKVGRLGDFVRRRNAGEVLDFTEARALVVTLDVAALRRRQIAR